MYFNKATYQLTQGGLVCSEGKWKRSHSETEGSGGTERVERGGCSQHVLYERINKKKNLDSGFSNKVVIASNRVMCRGN